MTDLPGPISATTAAAAFESLRIPLRKPNIIAAKEARRVAEHQASDGEAEPDAEPNMVIHSAEVALNLLDLGFHHPEQNFRHAQDAYEND